MKNQEINNILEQYKKGIASQDEVTKLNDWYRSTAYVDAEYPDMEQSVKTRIFLHLTSQLNPRPKRKSWSWIAVAATLLLVIGAGTFFINSYLGSNARQKNILNAKYISPGKNSAILTLADGKTIQLSNNKTGIVTTASGLTYNDGTAIDSTLKNEVTTALTLTTPRGGQYQTVLPDGTRVWLNAASSIKFPSRFIGNERVVELNGEAYFEVSKLNVKISNAETTRRVPFIVISNGQQVEVLGTHFNINSYLEEGNIKTTLLEGSVRVSSSSGPEIQQALAQHVVLLPGEQSVFSAGRIVVKAVDAEYITAWKNGKLSFKNESLQSIMRKVSRWYNVEVAFQNDQLMDKTFSGKVSRYDNVSEVLRILEMTGGAKFKIEKRKITVL